MTDSRTRAGIYARVSRGDEAGILRNQLDDLRELAGRYGYVVTREYVEVASGANDGRAELSRLLHDAALQRGRPWDVLLFRSLSRLTRTGTYGALDLLRQLQSFGVGWRFRETPVLDSTEDTPFLVSNVMLTLIAELDRDYREGSSRATRAAYARRLAAAEARGDRVRWGRPPGAKNRNREKVSPVLTAETAPKDIGAISGRGP